MTSSIRIVAAVAAAVGLAACESGDINLTPTTIDNSTGGGGGGGGGGTVNPCAQYTQSGQTFQGTYNADGNCVYSSLFASDTKPITVDTLTLPRLPNDGAHIFQSSLFVGEDVNANAAATGKRIPQEGEGPALVIEAGTIVAFSGADSYLRIARGSQIFAQGAADAPIIITADEDPVAGGIGATDNDRGLWGGLVINGNGLTNKCHDGTPTGAKFAALGTTSEFAPTANNVHNCHVTTEGRPSTYGGNNNAESSGVLRYVQVKYAGFEVVDGDELNAITLNGVGHGTEISHVQVYTSQDDGFEMFGGAVNLDHIVAVNVGDDSIDYSEGYVGDIQYALVLQTSGSNRCIEADNTGGGRADFFTPTTMLRISNMTCITTPVDQGQGTNPSSKGDAEGVLIREGAFIEMYNSLITSNDLNMLSNECFEFDDTEGPETIDAAQNGTTIAISNLIACSEAARLGTVNAANVGFNVFTWFAGGDGSPQNPTNTNANNVIEAANLPASLVVGGVGTRGYLTADLLTNSLGGVLFDQATQLFDVATLPDGFVPGFFDTPTYLGAANEDDDWLAGWTFGLDLPLIP